MSALAHALPFFGVVVLLLGYSAFFSCSETAFFSLSRVALNRLRAETGYAARRLVQMLKQPRETLIGILLGNEITNITIAIAAAEGMNHLVPDPWVGPLVSVAVTTPLVVVFGEVLPKNFAIGLASRISLWLGVPMSMFLMVTTPIRWVLTRIADAGVRLFGGDPRQVRSMIIEEEFRHMVDLGTASGALSPSEGALIHGVFAFGDLTVAQVMTTAERMFRLPLNWPHERILEEVRQAQFSRVPVYQDDPDDIVGLIYVRDLLSLQRGREHGVMRELESIVRPVLFVAPTMRLEEVLLEFQRTKLHMAVVIDTPQHVVGLVTLDDVLDALIGHPVHAEGRS